MGARYIKRLFVTARPPCRDTKQKGSLLLLLAAGRGLTVSFFIMILFIQNRRAKRPSWI